MSGAGNGAAAATTVPTAKAMVRAATTEKNSMMAYTGFDPSVRFVKAIGGSGRVSGPLEQA